MATPSAQTIYRDISAQPLPRFDAAALAPLACDVSLVSEMSTPPELLVTRQIGRLREPRLIPLFWNSFDRLRASYEAGNVVGHPAVVLSHIGDAIDGCAPAMLSPVFRFFDHVNSVMFLHQTIHWLTHSGVKLHLYGPGWEAHPEFASCARGAIESDTMRLAVYRASRINLAAGVYGAVSPRLVEGLGAGGFFLMRYAPMDLIERFFAPLWQFCAERNIASNSALAERATPAIDKLLEFAMRTIGVDPLVAWPDFVGVLRESAAAGYMKSAAAIWPEYPSVCFSTQDELLGMVARFLYDVPERQRLADDMRRRLAGRFDHVRVTRRVSSPEAEVAA